MNTIKRKGLALFLAVCLALTGVLTAPLPALAAGTVTGTFPLVDGMDVATVRYLYEEDGETVWALADLERTELGYAYSFTAPTDDFVKTEAASYENTAGATVIAEYFSLSRWDGAVDVSWYNETDDVFYIYTPAQFAGLAAIVNGSVDGKTEDYRIKGDRSMIANSFDPEGSLPGRGVGPLHSGLPEHDFSDRTVVLMSDLDMGGADGSAISHYGSNDTESHYDYPNWMPIGGQYLADLDDFDSMVMAFFNGTFEGNGHRIDNIYCYRRVEGTDPEGRNNAFCYGQGTGVFGAIGTLYRGEETPAADPAIRNVSVSGYVYGRRMVGGLVGYAGGGSNSVEYNVVNGVNIENCASHMYVYNTDSKGVAGIVATAMVRGNIINCYNDGNISTNYANPAGGIVGSNEGMNIYCCYNAGQISTNGNSRGRGIGSNADAGKQYTVDNCYYLSGCGDDRNYPGYYTSNLAPSVSVTTTAMSASEITDGTLLDLLNVNGTAYAAGSSGRPILLWETQAMANVTAAVEQAPGGSLAASTSGTVRSGSVIYLSGEADTGWSFRWYTLNGRPLTGHYATVSTDAVLSVYFEAVRAGVLNISPNQYCDISVVKTGTVEQDGEMVSVTHYPVANGDALYENDVLTVTAVLHEGAVPENEDMLFSAAAGLANPYTYTYTYTGTDVEPETKTLNSFTVGPEISQEGACLLLTVTPLETQKLWRHSADVSWYDETASVFTVSTARQLAGIQTLVLSGESFSGKTILLDADISMANDDGTSGNRFWDGIGNANYKFCGTFDGQGHSVRELHVNALGLFGYVQGTASQPAVIRNVTVYGDANGVVVAGIAAYGQNAEISGCSSYSILNGSGSYAGGILGCDQGGCVVTDCFNYGSVSGIGQVGGIVGQLSATGSVSGCLNSGAVKCPTAGNYSTGGVVGTLNGTVLRSANKGSVTAAGRNTGGIAGQSVSKSAAVTDCYNAGAVIYDGGTSTLDSAGGVFGFASYYAVSNSFNFGAVIKRSGSLETNIGGVFGRDGRRSVNTTENVFFNTESSPYAVMSIPASELGDLSYWSGITAAEPSAFAETQGVLTGINGNASFLLLNGIRPELAFESGSVHVHSGGTATCVRLAVCDACGLEYGETDPDHHAESIRTDDRPAAWTEDGYTGDLVCADCGTVLERGESIPADPTSHAFTVKVIFDGETLRTKDYTVAEFDALKTEIPIGYSFGSSLMASDRYVTVSTLLADNGIAEDAFVKVVAKGPGLQGTLTKEDYETKNKYYDAEGTEFPAPAAVCIRWNSGAGTIESLMQDAVMTGDLRFGYGISEDEKDGSSAGNRLISPVNELLITLAEEPAGVTVSGTVTGYAGEGAVTVALLRNGQTVLSTETDGAGYLLAGVVPGEYELTVSADGDYVARTYGLTVGTEDTALDLTILLLGDVDMDGQRSAADVTAIGRHLAKLETITDPYALVLADTNRDGSLSAADATRLGQFIAKLISEL